MIIEAVKRGLLSARSNWKLIAALWAVNALFALTAAVPAWIALNDAMAALPLADSLATSFSGGVLADLTELAPDLLRGLGGGAAGILVFGLFAGLAVAGGALETLAHGGGERFAVRFGRGAFLHYGRFLRLGLATLLLGGVTAGAVAGPLFALRGYVRREAGSEVLTLAVLAAAIAAAALMVLMALLAQDAARVTIVRDGVRGVFRALRRGLALVWRQPIAWLGTWTLNSALLLAALAAYVALARVSVAAPLLLLVALQQLFVLTRCALRVALLGSELVLVPFVPVPEPAAKERVEPEEVQPREETPGTEGDAPAPAPDVPAETGTAEGDERAVT